VEPRSAGRRRERLFARLAVFAGGCTLEAAEEVCDADLDTLQALVEKNLLRREGDRFSMLETIREYALERLEESDEADELRGLHARFYLALAERLDTGRPEDRHRRYLTARAVLHPEFANALAALDRFECEHDHEREARLAVQLLWWEWNPREGGRRLDRVLGYEDVPVAVRVRAVHGASDIAQNRGDWTFAAELNRKHLGLARALGDKWVIIRALTTLMNVSNVLGDRRSARRLLREAKSIALEIGDESLLGNMAATEAHLALYDERFDTARACFERALVLYRSADNGLAVASVLSTLAGIEVAEGRHEDAAAGYRESLAVRRGHLWRAEYELDGLAAVATARGEAAVAARLLGAADAVREASGAVPEPFEAAMRDRTRAAAREALGDDAFERALAEGRAMTLEAAVEYALASVD
jgi:tetratricopeptide (TPR) repeat protein